MMRFIGSVCVWSAPCSSLHVRKPVERMAAVCAASQASANPMRVNHDAARRQRRSAGGLGRITRCGVLIGRLCLCVSVCLFLLVCLCVSLGLCVWMGYTWQLNVYDVQHACSQSVQKPASGSSGLQLASLEKAAYIQTQKPAMVRKAHS